MQFPPPLHSALLRDGPGGEWLYFRSPEEIIEASRLDQVLPGLALVEARVQEGLHAAGFVSYEASPAFDPKLETLPPDDFPLLWFGLYAEPQRLARLPKPPINEPLPQLDWQPNAERPQYDAAIAQIKEHIARGDTYQVNYTLRLHTPFDDDPWALFLRLAAAQSAGYAAYLDTGRFVLCSASPELFFELQSENIHSKPMKGTVGRGRTLAEDLQQAEWLARSEKDRAENVMIVDMLRNDLGRVAQVGSVHVPALFELERYPTLWQMTSTVAARTEASLVDIFKAIFPCASITGAPKRRTMQIIAALETAPRRAYCGAIGQLSPGRQARFNVAIRTVIADRQEKQAEYGVGGGIVWDSTSQGEYDECLVKARVLTDQRPDFRLLESLLWSPETGFYLMEAHLQRLKDSAEYFDFSLDLGRVQAELTAFAAELPPSAHKLRLLLSKDGTLELQAQALEGGWPRRIPAHDPRASALLLGIAAQPVNNHDPFLFHKTTNRQVYERALASCPECDDVILWNQRDELTETCFGNLVLTLDGRRLTPTLDCGLLPGVFRQMLLETGQVQETMLRLEDLARCTEIFVVNSVRGWRRAQVLHGENAYA